MGRILILGMEILYMEFCNGRSAACRGAARPSTDRGVQLLSGLGNVEAAAAGPAALRSVGLVCSALGPQRWDLWSKANLRRLWLPWRLSLWQMLRRWFSTVLLLIPRTSAISLLVRSSAINLRMRRSAAVSSSICGLLRRSAWTRSRRRSPAWEREGLMKVSPLATF